MKLKTFFTTIFLLAEIALFNITAQYTKLYEFRDSDNNNLSNPYYTQFATDGSVLYGMTYSGGAYNYGTIFKIDTDGSGLQKLLDFDGTNKGAQPIGSLTLSGTTLYGMTSYGGANNNGVIFKINTDGSGFQKLLDFNYTNSGSHPEGSLTLFGTTLYGMTNSGGNNGLGIIFKINTNGTGFQKMLDFDGTNKGSYPNGSLTILDTTLYGMTSKGGANNVGVIFQIYTNGNGYKKLLDFDGTNKGSNPMSSLTVWDSTLYGMAGGGGVNGDGVVFKVNIDGSGYRKLLDFDMSKGIYPYGSLVLSDTMLYGMPYSGGSHYYGTIFKISIKGNGYRKLLDFDGTNKGEYPYGSLTLSGTSLYGMTRFGGTSNNGVIFKIDTAGTFSKLKDLYSAPQGYNPNDLTVDDSTVYGTTQYGGAYGSGTIYKIKTDGSGFQKIFDFNVTNGYSPTTSLTLSGDTLYGMTNNGGAHSAGVIFKINKNGNGYQDLLDFDGTNGTNPYGSLTISGKVLYGMTAGAGANGDGLIFKINTDGSGYQDLLDFDGTNSGRLPTGSLILSGTTLYGMTDVGGVNDYGVIFKVNTNGSGFLKLLDFDGTNGRQPQGSLTLSGTVLYGMTYTGGANGAGVIFKINTDSSGFRKLIDFNSANSGAYFPYGSLALSDTTLYGMTQVGGANGYGTLFKIYIGGSGFQKLVDFDGINNGSQSRGSVILSGEMLYGTTQQGGTDGMGVVFKYRPDAAIQATNIQFTNITSTQMDISFTKGDGDYRAVFMCQGSTGTPSVTDSTTYTANATFGLGTQAGTGWYCVANGALSGSSITVTGLTTTNTYRVMVIEYTGENGGEHYLTATVTSNPANTIKDDQTITFNALSAKTYGDADFDPAATASSGLAVIYISSDTAVATIVSGEIHIINAGTSDITASQAGNGDYNAASDVVRTLTVNKATLTVTADNKTREVGESNPAFTLTYSGWVGTDNADSLETKPTATCSATSTSPAGDYDINVAGGVDNNYTFSYVKGTLTVQPNAVINNLAEGGVEIYPVPANDKLYIKLSNSRPATLQIIDLSGQVLLSRQLTNEVETIDVSEFAKGTYIIKIIMNDALIIKKIEIR